MEAVVARAVMLALPFYRKQVMKWTEDVQSASRPDKIKLSPLDKRIERLMEYAMITAYLVGAEGSKIDMKRQGDELMARAIAFADDDSLGKMLEVLSGIDSMFPAAAQAFEFKTPVDYETYKRITGYSKTLAFSVARLESMAAINDVKDALQLTFKRGQTFADFQKEIAAVFMLQGYTPLKPFHLETVFRTNLMSVYASGKFETCQTADNVAAYEYAAIMDSRVRDSHRAMDGKIYEKTNPIWRDWMPPNGYNCRCTVIPITKAYAKAHNLKFDTKIPEEAQGGVEPSFMNQWPTLEFFLARLLQKAGLHSTIPPGTPPPEVPVTPPEERERIRLEIEAAKKAAVEAAALEERRRRWREQGKAYRDRRRQRLAAGKVKPSEQEIADLEKWLLEDPTREKMRSSRYTNQTDCDGGINRGTLILKNGEKVVRKCYLGEYQGELRPGVPVGGMTDREYAASIIDDVMGWGQVPKVTYARYGQQDGIFMKFVEDGIERGSYYMYGETMAIGRDQLQKSMIFDIVIGHSDRHGGNWMIDPQGKVHLIDNGLCLPDVPDFHFRYSREDRKAAFPSGQININPYRAQLQKLLDNRPTVTKMLTQAGNKTISLEAIELMYDRIEMLLKAPDGKITFGQLHAVGLR